MKEYAVQHLNGSSYLNTVFRIDYSDHNLLKCFYAIHEGRIEKVSSRFTHCKWKVTIL